MKKLIRSVRNWQHWPFFPFYFPLFFLWAWYILKSRSIWFFSASNPTLTFGGFEGESKREMYNQLPPSYFPNTLYVSPAQSFEQVLEGVRETGLTYPFIGKPDVGMEGILFRKIDNEEHLRTYHEQMPVEYILQDFVDHRLEIGLFYHRHPANDRGVITALFAKKFPALTGDGSSSIRQLAEMANPLVTEELQKLGSREMSRVPPKDETIHLSFIGNRYHGATFHDLSHEIDDALLALFDGISHSGHFYYGRYDIKCASVEEMKKGRHFSILEFNGAGSIPNHIYTERYSMGKAYREIAAHWKTLYHISRYNHSQGVPYWGLWKGTRYLMKAKKHFRYLKECNKELVLGNRSMADQEEQ